MRRDEEVDHAIRSISAMSWHSIDTDEGPIRPDPIQDP